MTTPTTGAAELPEALSVEAAYSGDKLIGYVLRTSGDPRPLLVWADQSVMTGFRMGDGFVPGFQETIDYRPMKLYAENEALRAQPAGAQVPEAVLQAIRAAGMHLIRGMNDVYSLIPAMNATAQPAGAATPAAPFQSRVQPWLLECFGAEIAADRTERNHRFLEESLELVQAIGCTASEAHQLVEYVFGRPVGDPPQEVGGVMVTLAALCLANGLDMHDAGEVELSRISAPDLVAKIRAKQAAKPKHSPLPATPAAPAPGVPSEHYDEVRATLTGLHSLCENISGMERRVGPLGSHARGYTHNITAALRHLDALAAAPQPPAATPEAQGPVGVITGKLGDICQFRSTTMRKGDAVYAAPPPKSVREPLSDEQVRRWWERDNGLEDCNLCKLDDFMKAVRAVETAHGITKGGQHGPA